MTDVKLTEGILISIEVELCRNIEIVGLPQRLANLAREYGGNATILGMSQTKALLFVEFKKNKQKKKFLEEAFEDTKS